MNETLTYIHDPSNIHYETLIGAAWLEQSVTYICICSPDHAPGEVTRELREMLATCYPLYPFIEQTALHKCDEVWVVTFDGWEHSDTISAKLSLARDRGMLIRYYDPVTKVLSNTP